MNRSSARFAAYSRGARHGDRHSATKGFGFIQPDTGGADVFVHISAVERAGMRDLNEGQKIAYEVVADRRTGKSSADNLKPV
jgi:cold shock protein